MLNLARINNKYLINRLQFNGRHYFNDQFAFLENTMGISRRLILLNIVLILLLQSAFSVAAEKDAHSNIQSTSTHNSLAFTPQELQWLDKKQVISYVYDPDWPPFEWTNGIQEHTGIIADILSIITDKTGIEFKPVQSKTWSDAVKLVKTNKVDMYSAVVITEEREKYLNFTSENIYSYLAVFISDIKNKDYTLDDSDRLEDKKIALIKGNLLSETVRTNYPKAKYVYVDSAKEGFDLVNNKQADLFAINAATATYYILNKGYSEIKVYKKIDFVFNLKIALQKNIPIEVISILDKAILSIGKKQLSDIFHKWTVGKEDQSTRVYQIVLIVTLTLLIITTFILIYMKFKHYITSNEEKDKRADELTLAKEEKEKKADELGIANVVLAFQLKEKDKREAELTLANEEKAKQAEELILNRKHQAQLEHIARYDILTNLPNRSLLADRLSQAMLQCNRSQQSLAVAFLDLDGFKAVNDLHGHEVGDKLLIALSLRMKEALRESDTLARFGGDEFVAVLTNLVNVEDCEPLLERLLLAASKAVTVGDVVLNVSASVGVTFYPQDDVNADQLIRHADQAMYVAKESGKNRYHIFDTHQDDAVKDQRESLEAIRNALDHHQFVLHYQPKVNMQTGKVIGFEALIRWQHPERGLLNPIEFLPVIEHHAMMVEMGEWVIDTALTQINQWQGLGHNLLVSISVNIAALQLQQSDFADRLAILLAAHPDVEPRYLELEVLETSALGDVQHVSTNMNSCIALGVSFALDDFGTGYSSLTHLRRLPTNLIKIDQSFVRDMLTDPDDLAIVEGVIALAKSFKREVIAEGVETIAHGTALLQLGCELAQGYGIARPMPAADIPEWVNDWKPDKAWKV